jgi:hypothetical protein
MEQNIDSKLGSGSSSNEPETLLKCPYGCFFQFKLRLWEGLKKDINTSFVCLSCHRSESIQAFCRDDKSSSVLAVKGVVLAQGPKELEIEEAIKRRLGETLKLSDKNTIKSVFNLLAKLLINSELTSNFPTPRIFQIISSGQLKNMWQVRQDMPRNDETDNEKKYASERDSGEKKLFKPLSQAVSEVPTGSARPVYIGLNPGCLIQGAAPPYGQSYIVFKNAVKLRCTFMATDSLQMIKTDKTLNTSDVCCVSNIHQLLLRMSERQLCYLYSLVGGPSVNNPNEFIEAQGWGNITLASDVQAIVVSELDLKRMVHDKSKERDLVPESFQDLSANARQVSIDMLLKELNLYCNMHKIDLYLLPLGKDTMNSRERRPQK